MVSSQDKKENGTTFVFSPDCSGKPGAKKVEFLSLKKRPKEALFRVLETQLFCEDL